MQFQSPSSIDVNGEVVYVAGQDSQVYNRRGQFGFILSQPVDSE